MKINKKYVRDVIRTFTEVSYLFDKIFNLCNESLEPRAIFDEECARLLGEEELNANPPTIIICSGDTSEDGNGQILLVMTYRKEEDAYDARLLCIDDEYGNDPMPHSFYRNDIGKRIAEAVHADINALDEFLDGAGRDQGGTP